MEELTNSDEQRKVIHKLRGPLTTIRLNTEVLLSGSAGVPSAEQREMLEDIYTASGKLVDLLNELSTKTKTGK